MQSGAFSLVGVFCGVFEPHDEGVGSRIGREHDRRGYVIDDCIHVDHNARDLDHNARHNNNARAGRQSRPWAAGANHDRG